MGLRIVLEIHQVDDLEIDDLDALNTDLMSGGYGGFGELYSNMGTQYAKEPFAGPFRQGANGILEIANNGEGEFEGYDQYSEVWGCWDANVAQTIAGHMISGKLVFHQEIEGNPNVYWILTPGNVVTQNAGALTF